MQPPPPPPPAQQQTWVPPQQQQQWGSPSQVPPQQQQQWAPPAQQQHQHQWAPQQQQQQQQQQPVPQQVAPQQTWAPPQQQQQQHQQQYQQQYQQHLGHASQAAAAAPQPLAQPGQQQWAPPPPQQQQQQQQQQSMGPASPQLPPPELAAPVPGLRWTFNTYPNTGKPKPSAADGGSQWGPPTPEMVLPLAALYTPLFDPVTAAKASPKPPQQPQDDADNDGSEEAKGVVVVPVASMQDIPKCGQCGAYWNHGSRCDFQAGYWLCPACLARNALPAGATASHPTMLYPTIEYNIANESAAVTGAAAPIFIFVVDVCLPPEELAPLKESLLRALEWLPTDARVGIISFGHSVTLWEPGFSELNKCYAFRGNRSYTKQELLVSLGVSQRAAATGPDGSGAVAAPPALQGATGGSDDTGILPFGTGPVSGRFLVPLEENEFTISSVLEDLQVDPFTPKPKERALRATGAALELATSLLELAGGPNRGGKIMLFTGGPCTRGPGAIVSVDKSEMIRSHRDLLDGNAPMFQAASDFYNQLEERMSAVHVALDVYIMSLDQIGLLEMRPCVDGTGGNMICGDSFGTAMYLDSIKRVLERARFRDDCEIPVGSTEPSTPGAAGCGFSALLRVFVSSDTRVCGAIGPCRAKFGGNAGATAKAQGDDRYVSPVKIGVAQTTQWVMSAIDATSTFTIVFDTESDGVAPGTVVAPSEGQRRFVQFVTTYVTVGGSKRLRVTSVAMPIARSLDSTLFAQPGVFDQEAAAVVTSRMSVDVMEKHDNRPLDLTRRWIDRILVKFVKKYGSYRINDPSSLRLAPVFALFPVFLFNLRRSEYFMLLNISPDETTFKRHYLRREPCDHCLRMIQPTVYSYDMYSEEAAPVPLDSESIKRENVLLMDAFFNVAVLRGATVEEWRKAGYQDQPDYAAFKSLLERPERDADVILSTRVPYPRYTNCDQYGSQARHVLTRLNPSASHHSGIADSRTLGANHQGPVKEIIYTDDASISRFMQTLKAAAVAADN